MKSRFCWSVCQRGGQGYHRFVEKRGQPVSAGSHSAQLSLLLPLEHAADLSRNSSWYVRVTAIKDKLLEANAQILWFLNTSKMGALVSGWTVQLIGRIA